MASSGALDFIFQRRGVFTIGAVKGDMDEFELNLIDAGLEDIFESEEGFLLYSTFENFGALQRALEEAKVEIKSAGLQRVPLSTIELAGSNSAELDALLALLEEDDDVQHVFHNMKLD
jgi:transcriptional/translational regulatory protein YebC/TACO1